MDFAFTDKEKAFRAELRSFLAKELPAGWGKECFLPRGCEEWVALAKQFMLKLGKKGWRVPSWPREFGGFDTSGMEQYIYQEEMGYAEAPGWDDFGPWFIGPALLMYGTEEQKREHLPPIACGETTWCQGFSEPDAGSDLASLKTRAVDSGDYFVINGQKVWTSRAHYADWCALLARTDPTAAKHRGISMFLFDMKTPGITLRPLVNMLGEHLFNETFIDSARVPKHNLLGGANGGWHVVMTVMDLDRAGIGGAGSCRRALDLLVDYANETRVGGRPLAEAPVVRRRLAELAVDTEVARLLSYRCACLQSKGITGGREGSMVRLFHTQLEQRLGDSGMKLLGLYGQLAGDSKWAQLRGRIQHLFLYSVGATIAGGTSEILRNVIATRGLGLPR